MPIESSNHNESVNKIDPSIHDSSQAFNNELSEAMKLTKGFENYDAKAFGEFSHLPQDEQIRLTKLIHDQSVKDWSANHSLPIVQFDVGNNPVDKPTKSVVVNVDTVPDKIIDAEKNVAAGGGDKGNGDEKAAASAAPRTHEGPASKNEAGAAAKNDHSSSPTKGNSDLGTSGSYEPSYTNWGAWKYNGDNQTTWGAWHYNDDNETLRSLGLK